MELAEFDELAVWIKENIFDIAETTAPQENVAAETEKVDALADSARLYHWCPRKKRLVQSS